MSSAREVGRSVLLRLTVWKELERKSTLSSARVWQSWSAWIAEVDREELRWRYLLTNFKNLVACERDSLTENRPYS